MMFTKYKFTSQNEQKRQRQELQKLRHDAAVNDKNSAYWGPSHSFSSDSEAFHPPSNNMTPTMNKSHLTASTEGSTPSDNSPTSPHEEQEQTSTWMTQVWNSPTRVLFCQGGLTIEEDEGDGKETKSVIDTLNDDAIYDACSCPTLGIGRMTMGEPQSVNPSHNTNNAASMTRSSSKSQKSRNNSPLPPLPTTIAPQDDVISTSSTMDTPADRRRFKARQRLQRLGILAGQGKDVMERPIQSLELVEQDPYELSKTISELTMRSSYGQATAKLSEKRRMAYYAVGKHHRQSGRGGNRRCYFTGKLILGTSPFYAGSVQQGLRTLVVFCLPSSLGLPKQQQQLHGSSGNKRGSGLSKKQRSLTSMDELSLSVDEELDPNLGLDLEYLLAVLPRPNQELLREMKARFPAQYDTLPVQVRVPHCWTLYVKFCFFSGLPIAEGELHYKVNRQITRQYGEEIILSHEVLEAANGESAEILRLPNLKTFSYLKKHYNQQSEKLPESVFLRTSWEMVLPEI